MKTRLQPVDTVFDQMEAVRRRAQVGGRSTSARNAC